MERVAVDDAESSVLGADVERRGLTGPLGTTGVALVHYRVPPGEGLPAGLHAHADQAEVFLVREGTAVFETLVGVRPDEPTETREVTVEPGEAVRFAPGEFQSGRNAGEVPLVVLALGAPRESEDVRLPVACPSCAHPEVRLDTAGGLSFVCPACGIERVPADCPACGGSDLRVRLAGEGDGDGTVVVCEGCGSTFDRPPLEG